MSDLLEKRLGKVELSPSGSVVAGSMMEWTLTYTAGSYGVDERGLIILAQRLACDMERPQFDSPSASGYTTVETNGNCRLVSRFECKRVKRPWMKWNLVIDVKDGYLSPGDKVIVRLGDRSKGSPGIRAQTFQESNHDFLWLVDPTNAADPVPLPSSPKFPIVAGEPVKLECLLPSLLKVGEQTHIFVKGVDEWGNPTSPPNNLKLSLIDNECASLKGEVLFAESPGIVRIEASTECMKCAGNPVKITESAHKRHPFWADLHGQTDNTVGTGSVEEYFDFARHWSQLDIVGHQGNDFQVTDEDWKALNDAIKRRNRTDQMVILPGYEWSANTCAGGDHNVFFLEDDPPILRSSHWQIPGTEENDLSPAHPLDVLFEKLKSLQDFHALVIPHVGGRFADVRKYFDSDLEPVVEILSCHGIFEWLLWDALEAGNRVGVVCNSDGHKGRPGSEGPGAGHFGVKGGLTCVLAEKRTREAVFEALKNRHCYGTTGNRMLLEFTADGHPMGSELISGDSVTLTAQVHGTAAVESLSLMKGKEVIHQVYPPEFANLNDSPVLRVYWEGARIRGRARRAQWNGEIRVDGAKILSAETFAFDSPADGILEIQPDVLRFQSSTVGDRDGIELRLDQARTGVLRFNSPVGRFSVDLEDLKNDEMSFLFGGLGLKAGLLRYPLQLESKSIQLNHSITPSASSEAYLVKAIQADGNMAWSSPIFIAKT